ncbi:MAG: DUF2232 domain-containing protein [Pseudolabrys sp.]|nr:DUF2232 domain-containing protein [Pseudolabrys sp.]
MIQIALIGLGAGAAAALLFASIASGSLLSVILFYLAPLPIMIAAIGWAHWAGLVAALGAAVTLGTIFGGVFLLGFLTSAGLPAWWLSYLAMLSRSSSDNTADIEWYPPGRLAVWAAALAASFVGMAILTFGTDYEAFRTGLAATVERFIALQSSDGSLVPGESHKQFTDLLVAAIPPTAASVTTITLIVNLGLAARIVKFSGLLHRPWPDLTAMTFPLLAAIALAIAAVASFFGGLVGVIASAITAALLMAFGVLGFAVLHTLTRGINARPFVLGAAYGAVIVFGWPILALCLLGLAETAFRVRARLAPKASPPAPH